MKVSDIKYDDAFRELLPPLTKDERATLRANILEDGEVRDSIVVGEEKALCVDWHNRSEVYQELTAEGYEISCPRVKLKSFASHEEAKRWIEQNARGQRNLVAKWTEILIGREYLRKKKSVGQPEKVLGQPDPILSDRSSATLAATHGKGEKTVRRYAKKAEVYDVVEQKYGKDSDEARSVMTASHPVIETIGKVKSANVIVATIAKVKAAMTKALKKQKATSNGKPKKGTLYEDCTTPIQQMLGRVKPLGRVPKEEFQKALGCESYQRWFALIVDELHYMHIEEYDDGTCELVINERERELCTAIVAQLERMRQACAETSRFNFNVDRFKIITRDLYELARKAAMHE